jgi:hypothetical protein
MQKIDTEIETKYIKDYFKDDWIKVDSQRTNFYNIIGTEWFTHILALIQVYENNDYIYRVSKNRLNLLKEPFLVAHIYCNVCKIVGKISIKNFDPEDDMTNFELDLNQHDELVHASTKSKKSIRGKDRDILKLSILGPNNHGSAKMYRENLAADGVTVLPSNDVLRKAIQEKKFELIHGSDWIDCIVNQANSIEGVIIDGYVRELKLHDHFSMTLHTNLQLNALNLIKGEQRIMYFDGTGNMVRIEKNKGDYKQILTHALIVHKLISYKINFLIIFLIFSFFYFL